MLPQCLFAQSLPMLSQKKNTALFLTNKNFYSHIYLSIDIRVRARDEKPRQLLWIIAVTMDNVLTIVRTIKNKGERYRVI